MKKSFTAFIEFECEEGDLHYIEDGLRHSMESDKFCGTVSNYDVRIVPRRPLKNGFVSFEALKEISD